MATFKSDAVNNGLKVDEDRAGGVICRSCKYTNDGEKAAGSVIAMVPVPFGARLLRIDYKTSALGAGRTLDIGDTDTVDKFVDGDDVSAAVADSVVLDEELTADTDIGMTILGDVLDDGEVLSMHVYYKMASSIEDEVA